MPRYDYQCMKCGCIIEINHGFHDVITSALCPQCRDNQQVTKLITDVDFRLSWRVSPHPGKRTPVKRIGKQLYDADSYAKAKAMGRFGPAKNPKTLKYDKLVK